MRIIGVDPGKSGAIAWRDYVHPSAAGVASHGGFTVVPMPLVRSSKGRDEYDLDGLHRILYAPGAVLATHVFIERQQALPAKMGGGLANYSRGYTLGVLEGFCIGRLPYTLVTPRRWQATMLDGIPGSDTKVQSILAAQRIFPNVDLRRTERSRIPDHGFADALLICEFGWRQLNRLPSDVDRHL